ncbi:MULTISPECIES: DUF72 domain-containing protein [unclassified Polaromonas]|uniref:DUF72 domain-containing protein n=1 Tax=unclassified Polaromonas TaxID=2638319 RepID=UPI000F08C515|nr:MULTISPECIES: DUF72 domain-containing protein [unclassified Polaromonas]AYQ27785.1 DUF72 domain-containing protein [Polaromonas sp. SP1]QGJ17358.1 DUF72 domain-containing protein [Polaromonas sp. Pch-P]
MTQAQPVSSASADSRIRAGVGGWTFEPWRSNFFPPGLPHSRELEYASRKLSAIEVNGTYYGTLKPASFKKWHDETPDDFVFSLKASRYATNRRVLAEAGDSIQRFIDSGISELGRKLGPIVWQFMPGKVFDAADFEAFLALLPKQAGSLALRHVVDVRHESFMSPDYLALARRYKVATVFTDADKFPSFADLTGDFAYARLMMSDAGLETGYEGSALDAWAQRARQWAAGDVPVDLPALEDAPAPGKPRDVFVYFINGAKERAPAAAMAFLDRLGFKPTV